MNQVTFREQAKDGWTMTLYKPSRRDAGGDMVWLTMVGPKGGWKGGVRAIGADGIAELRKFFEEGLKFLEASGQ